MVLIVGNVVGKHKGRRAGQLAKDRMTVGLFWNATGDDFYNLCSSVRPHGPDALANTGTLTR